MGIELLLITAAIATAASATVSAVGQFQAARAAENVAEFNAAVLRNDAVNAQKWSAYREEREREKAKHLRANMVTQFLSSGVTIDEGTTPALVIEEQLIQDEMDAIAIRRAGVNEANALENRARVTLFEGDQNAKALRIGGVTTLITGVAQSTAIGAKVKQV